MNDFYFHLNTKFYFGRGVAADIAEEILNYGRKVFSFTMKYRRRRAALMS